MALLATSSSRNMVMLLSLNMWHLQSFQAGILTGVQEVGSGQRTAVLTVLPLDMDLDVSTGNYAKPRFFSYSLVIFS